MSRFVVLEQLRELSLRDLADELVQEAVIGVTLPASMRSNPIVYRHSTTAPGYDCKLVAYPQHEKISSLCVVKLPPPGQMPACFG